MSAHPSPLVWFITGASSGFGAALAIHVLEAGHKVIGTARDPTKASKSYPEVERLGGKWLALDVTSPSIGSVVTEASKVYGRIDVVVNNAGYSLLGAVEDINDDEAQMQMETNFFGPLRVIRAALPLMRAQNSGTIVNVSSVAGLDGLPTCGLYAGSKFALEGLSESLSREVAPFNIRVLIVNPGAFRTNFLTASKPTKVRMSAAYAGTAVENTLQHFERMNGAQKGDVAKGAARIFEAVTGRGFASGGRLDGYLRLLLGSDCLDRAEKKVNCLRENLEACREIARSTDYDQ